MIINKLIIILVLVLLNREFYSQTDWIRWEKSNPSYQKISDHREREFDLIIKSPSDIIIKPIINAYWFFVSDVDGANCPFHPSCSSFLVKSIKETNIFQGTLMFFDRFTRDTNVFGRSSHYPRYGKNQFYDPVNLYTLDKNQIKVFSPNTFVDHED